MKTAVLALLCAATSAYGQTWTNYIATTGNAVLVAATTAATLQQPATNSRPVAFPSSTVGGLPPAGVSIYCSVACTATFIRNATAATATAGTVANVNPNEQPAVVQFYTASNYSGGTTLAVVNIPAASTSSFDLSAIKLPAGNATTNLTVAISSITGTANITFYPMEQH